MARELCSNCQRALANCLCQFITNIDNDINVIILQHPSEIKQHKASVPILARSLTACMVLNGEDFTEHQLLNALLHQYQNRCFLLYPNENASVIKASINTGKQNNSVDKYCLILIDGTWKKAYKIFQLSNNLHQLPSLVLPADIKGQYLIRKTQKANALSTLEACCYGLGLLENNAQRYQPLLDNFVNFNRQQLTFVPKEHR